MLTYIIGALLRSKTETYECKSLLNTESKYMNYGYIRISKKYEMAIGISWCKSQHICI